MTHHREPLSRLLAPVSLDHLKKKAKTLLRQVQKRSPDALDLYQTFLDAPPAPEAAKLSDAQLALARSLDFPSWPRLKHGAALFAALSTDDPDRVLAILGRHPLLKDVPVNGDRSNWGPPLACAAQLGSAQCVRVLLTVPGQDMQWALDRAVLKGHTTIAQLILEGGARLDPGLVMGPCETLDYRGLAFLDQLGADLCDESGDPLAPVALVLEGYLRRPSAKHRFLEFFENRGIRLPDTPVMALHRGRPDLLARHLDKDPVMLNRCFQYRDIYPLELGCHEDMSLGLHGAPLDGTTLLHMAVDFDEYECADWLLSAGADVNARARVDEDGFGGHTALFNLVVSQAWRSGRQRDDRFLDLLFAYGADPSLRASVRKGIRFHTDERTHEYRNVTALEFGMRFHARDWVSDRAVERLQSLPKP